MADPVLTASGALTREALLSAARSLFIADGFAATSMRKVAKECGVSLGHLQHFFPTKDALLTEMLLESVGEYAAAYQRFVNSLTLGPRERLEAVLRHLLEDARNPKTSGFFVELWSVTLRGGEPARALRENYGQNLRAVEPFIRAVRPELSEPQSRLLAIQLIAVIDGVIVYWHTERPPKKEFEQVSSAAVQNMLAMIDRAD